MAAWFIYIVRCRDGSLYTGSTTDLSRRLTEHNEKSNGARYTHGRRPVTLVYAERSCSRSAALKRESAIKKLSKKAKEQLIKRQDSTINILRIT